MQHTCIVAAVPSAAYCWPVAALWGSPHACFGTAAARAGCLGCPGVNGGACNKPCAGHLWDAQESLPGNLPVTCAEAHCWQPPQFQLVIPQMCTCTFCISHSCASKAYSSRNSQPLAEKRTGGKRSKQAMPFQQLQRMHAVVPHGVIRADNSHEAHQPGCAERPFASRGNCCRWLPLCLAL